MKMKIKILKPIALLILILVALASSIWIWSYAKANGDEIRVCVLRNGLMFIIGEGLQRTECMRNEKLLSWNIQGPPGPQGPPGQPSWDEERITSLEKRVAELEKLHADESNPFIGIVQDNFNSYTNGSIVGQGNWQNYKNGENFSVQEAIVYEGARALHASALADSVITKTGTPRSDGKQMIYVRTENRSSWGIYPDGNVGVRIAKGSIGTSSIFASVSFKEDGNVAYYDPVADVYQNFATYNDNEWTLLEIEWRSSDKRARYRVNNGTWTDWLIFKNNTSFTDFDNVGFNFILPSGSGGVYFDNLQ
jgi:hypothetical protein